MIDLNLVKPGFDARDPFDSEFRRGTIEAFTSNLEAKLIERIRRADFVSGCMAWLTNRKVLAALARVRDGVQIVVQKEDFIRPGIVGKGELQKLYGALSSPGVGYNLPCPASGLNVCGDACESVDPVRCMGIANTDHRVAYPRMHHKFFVFYKRRPISDEQKEDVSPIEHCVKNYDDLYPYGHWELVPYAVWTGSFNATQNAVNSRENAVYIADESLAGFYGNEWAQVYAVSEPLDWTTHFVDDEHAKRFGT